MSFMEILLIAIVAIIALGPEKLPQAMIDAAKFIRAFKKTLDDAKQNITREMQLQELKDEALGYKKEISDDIKSITQINLDKLADLELDSQSSSSVEKSTDDTPHVVVHNAPKSVGFGDFKANDNPAHTTLSDKEKPNV